MGGGCCTCSTTTLLEARSPGLATGPHHDCSSTTLLTAQIVGQRRKQCAACRRIECVNTCERVNACLFSRHLLDVDGTRMRRRVPRVRRWIACLGRDPILQTPCAVRRRLWMLHSASMWHNISFSRIGSPLRRSRWPARTEGTAWQVRLQTMQSCT